MPLSDTHTHADRIATVQDQFTVTLFDCHLNGTFTLVTAEQFGQVNLQSADLTVSTGNRRCLVMRKNNGIGRTDATAGRTAFLAVVLLLHQNPIKSIHPVDAKQTEVDALHAVRAAAVINHRIPASIRLLDALPGALAELGADRVGAVVGTLALPAAARPCPPPASEDPAHGH